MHNAYGVGVVFIRVTYVFIGEAVEEESEIVVGIGKVLEIFLANLNSEA